jgi:hypothetical protein
MINYIINTKYNQDSSQPFGIQTSAFGDLNYAILTRNLNLNLKNLRLMNMVITHSNSNLEFIE